MGLIDTVTLRVERFNDDMNKMGMSIDNLCNSCTNNGCEFQSGIVRTECAFYMPPHAEAIPKDQYEARLRDDMVAMLTEIQLEILELKSYESADGQDLVMLADIGTLFQQRINSLKED